MQDNLKVCKYAN